MFCCLVRTGLPVRFHQNFFRKKNPLWEFYFYVKNTRHQVGLGSSDINIYIKNVMYKFKLYQCGKTI